MLHTLWNKWKSLATKIGNFQFNVLFSILYFVIIFPVGFITNIFKDYLKVKGTPKWEKVKGGSSTIEDLREQS